MAKNYNHNNFLVNRVSKFLLVLNIILALVYFYAMAFLFPISNGYLFGVLIFTEIYHLFMAFTFWHTLWNMDYMPFPNKKFKPPVDVLIPCVSEPLEIVEQTLRAAKAMDYPDFRVYLLNDGYVLKKDNWWNYEVLAARLGVKCITRRVPGGAKAGNINHALRQTRSPFVAVFDCDHIPHRDFLKKTMSYMGDPKMAFVQTPQFYKNYGLNFITGGAWEQQELFFGPICKGRNRLNATFMCGTNMLIRRRALMQVGGMCDKNITEDFLTSLFIHRNGWRSVYLPEVLAHGLAPEDFLSYHKQQFRWARGSLEVVFKYNPLFMRGLTWAQRIHYLASSSYYLSGFVAALNALIPLIFFFTGQTPFKVSSMLLAAAFVPHIFLTFLVLSMASNYSFTYRAVAFSMSSFVIHIKAMFSVIFGIKQGFVVTPKVALQGNYIKLVVPHIIYLVLTIIGSGFAIINYGVTASVISNISWALINCAIFSVFIAAALPEPVLAQLRKQAAS